MDIKKLMAQYGPQLSRELHIVSTQLYDKLLWYTQVNGAIELAQIILTFFAGLVWIIAMWHIITRLRGSEWWKTLEDPNIPTACVVGVGTLTVLLAWFAVVGPCTDAIVKIVAPQYWLIDEVVQRVSSQ